MRGSVIRPPRRPGDRTGAPAVAALLAAAAGLVACGSPTTPQPTAVVAPASSVMVRLAHMPDGVATLGYNRSTRHVTVHLDVFGLAPGSTAQLVLRKGTCLAPTATVLAAFGRITADATGAARLDLVSDRAMAAGIPHGAVIELDAAGDGELACTDIPAAGATAPQRLFAPPRFKPVGTATVVSQGAGVPLHVTLSALDLRAGGSYTAELRSGSCQAQGKLVARLGALSADGAGAAALDARVGGVGTPPASAWYVAVLPGGGSSQDTPAGQPVLCGDVGAS